MINVYAIRAHLSWLSKQGHTMSENVDALFMALLVGMCFHKFV
jgi:hypothetical protein